MLRIVSPVLLSVALLSACGEGGSPESDAGAPATATSPVAAPSPTAPAALARADYLARSEAVCTKAIADIEAQPAPTGPETFEPFLRASLEKYDTATTALEDLAAPQPDADELQRIFLAPIRKQVTALTAYLPAYAAALSKGGAQALEAVGAPELVDADLTAMTAYGFNSCLEVGKTDG